MLTQKRWLAALIIAGLFVYYTFLLTSGHFDLFTPGDTVDLTFNSMARHLLAGRFDVDSTVVGLEGFRRGGHVYAYWGIWPALIRMPLVLFQRTTWLDVTGLSMVIAVTFGAAMKLLAVGEIWSETGPVVGSDLALCIALSGAQIEFLRPRIYDEVCVWATAFGAVFVYCAVRGLKRNEWSHGLLGTMAVAAGLSLLTRVSVAVGLYAGLGLLLAWFAVKRDRRWLAPLLILAAFAVLTALVNYARWGHPLTFANYDLHIGNVEDFPDRLPRAHQTGLFNLVRVPFGLMYYFVPVWVLQLPSGQYLFESFSRHWMDATELPPSSFLLTDPLLILIGLAGLVWWFRKQRWPRWDQAAILLGLAAPCVLMLSAISMNYRYRLDFYPFIEALAFIALLAIPPMKAAPPKRLRLVLGPLLIVSILASHAALLLYKISPGGPPLSLMPHGIAAFYQQAWRLIPH